MADLGWGAGGVSEANADMQAKQLSQMTLAIDGVKLQEARIALTQQSKMLALMSQMGQKSSPQSASYNLSDTMYQLANLAVQSGMPDKAREYADAGSTIAKNTSEIADKQFTETVKKLNVYGSLMEGVNSPTAWNQANAMYQLETGEASPYAKLPYSPELVAKLSAGIQTAKDRALTEAAKARTLAATAETSERKARIPLIKAQTDLDNARTDVLVKGSVVGKIPKSGDLREVTDRLTKDYGVPLDNGADYRLKARTVADRALDLVQTQHLNRAEAFAKAYDEAKARGDFGGLKPARQMMGSQAKPLDVPPDPAQLKPNMFYKNSKGQVALWNGKSFIEPSEAKDQDLEGGITPDELAAGDEEEEAR